MDRKFMSDIDPYKEIKNLVSKDKVLTTDDLNDWIIASSDAEQIASILEEKEVARYYHLFHVVIEVLKLWIEDGKVRNLSDSNLYRYFSEAMDNYENPD